MSPARPLDTPVAAPPAGMRSIDLRHLGRERVIGTWQVGDVLIDPGPASCVPELLGAVDAPPRAILLTHIHLDHAAATGTLVERWPDVEVYVHVRGARHVVDPGKLIASATRLYGDDMERLWGEIRPVPEANVTALAGGEVVYGLRALDTPGHASHHLAYVDRDSGWAFTGDVAGVRIAPSPFVLMPTMPPEVDVEAWLRSLRLLREVAPTAIAPTHFGAWTDVERHLDDAERHLVALAEQARTGDAADLERSVLAQLEAAGDAATVHAYRQAAPIEHLYAGARRYWDSKPVVGS